MPNNPLDLDDTLVGNAPNDNLGDFLRNHGIKTNANNTEVEDAVNALLDAVGLDKGDLTLTDADPVVDGRTVKEALLALSAASDIPDPVGQPNGLALFTQSDAYVLRNIVEADIGNNPSVSQFVRQGSTGPFLVGDTIGANTFTAAFAGYTPTAAEVSSNRSATVEAQSAPFTTATYAPTYTTTTFGNAVTWTLSATIDGTVYTRNESVSAYNNVYWGGTADAEVGSPPTIDAAYAASLGNSAIDSNGERTYAFSLLTGEYAVVLLPTRLVANVTFENDLGFPLDVDTLATGTFDNGSSGGFSEDFTAIRLTDEPALSPATPTYFGV